MGSDDALGLAWCCIWPKPGAQGALRGAVARQSTGNSNAHFKVNLHHNFNFKSWKEEWRQTQGTVHQSKLPNSVRLLDCAAKFASRRWSARRSRQQSIPPSILSKLSFLFRFPSFCFLENKNKYSILNCMLSSRVTESRFALAASPAASTTAPPCPSCSR